MSDQELPANAPVEEALVEEAPAEEEEGSDEEALDEEAIVEEAIVEEAESADWRPTLEKASKEKLREVVLINSKDPYKRIDSAWTELSEALKLTDNGESPLKKKVIFKHVSLLSYKIPCLIFVT